MSRNGKQVLKEYVLVQVRGCEATQEAPSRNQSKTDASCERLTVADVQNADRKTHLKFYEQAFVACAALCTLPQFSVDFAVVAEYTFCAWSVVAVSRINFAPASCEG